MPKQSDDVRPEPTAGTDPFSPEMEARVCEIVLGARRHGLSPQSGAQVLPR